VADMSRGVLTAAWRSDWAGTAPAGSAGTAPAESGIAEAAKEAIKQSAFNRISILLLRFCMAPRSDTDQRSSQRTSWPQFASIPVKSGKAV
jgi:hypothetical protein